MVSSTHLSNGKYTVELDALKAEAIALYKSQGEIKYWQAFDSRSIESMQQLIDTLKDQLSERSAATPNPAASGARSAATASRGEAPKKKSSPLHTGQGLWVKSPIDAIADPAITATQYRLLSLLTVLAGNNGCCWYGEQSLGRYLAGAGDKASMSERTIRRHTAALAKAGYIKIVEPHDLRRLGFEHTTDTNTYVLTFGLRDTEGVAKNGR